MNDTLWKSRRNRMVLREVTGSRSGKEVEIEHSPERDGVHEHQTDVLSKKGRKRCH